MRPQYAQPPVAILTRSTLMKPIHRSLLPLVLVCCAVAAVVPVPSAAEVHAAEAPALANIKSQADLDAKIAATGDPALKKALQANVTAILAAAAKKPHVDSVIAALDKASATHEKINTTPDELKKALGGDAAIFDTLKLVNLASPALGIKGKRETDPFDHAFYEHLGQIADLQSLTILNTSAHNDDLIPLVNLKNLKSLIIINQGKLNDEGLAHLAGLKQLERFSFVGTLMTGKPFKDFEGWTKLSRCSFRGSKIDDEGVKQLCDHFPALENISLAHANFTDAGAVHLAKLKNLKGLEIGVHGATPQCLQNIVNLPLEYLQLGEGVAPAGVAIVKDMKTLKQLTVTEARNMTDAEVMVIVGMTQLEHVELGSLDITTERLDLLKRLGFLKSLRVVRYGNPYTPETRAKVKEVLPHVALQFD